MERFCEVRDSKREEREKEFFLFIYFLMPAALLFFQQRPSLKKTLNGSKRHEGTFDLEYYLGSFYFINNFYFLFLRTILFHLYI